MPRVYSGLPLVPKIVYGCAVKHPRIIYLGAIVVSCKCHIYSIRAEGDFVDLTLSTSGKGIQVKRGNRGAILAADIIGPEYMLAL